MRGTWHGTFCDRCFHDMIMTLYIYVYHAVRCEKGTEEWYCGMTDGLSALLSKYSAPTSDSMDSMAAGEEVVSSCGLRPRVLMAGCGNSTLGVEVWKAGYDVVNADYVQVSWPGCGTL